jgi:hypothetical protein
MHEQIQIMKDQERIQHILYMRKKNNNTVIIASATGFFDRDDDWYVNVHRSLRSGLEKEIGKVMPEEGVRNRIHARCREDVT